MRNERKAQARTEAFLEELLEVKGQPHPILEERQDPVRNTEQWEQGRGRGGGMGGQPSQPVMDTPPLCPTSSPQFSAPSQDRCGMEAQQPRASWMQQGPPAPARPARRPGAAPPPPHRTGTHSEGGLIRSSGQFLCGGLGPRVMLSPAACNPLHKVAWRPGLHGPQASHLAQLAAEAEATLRAPLHPALTHCWPESK